jgi:multimeric flavodoxin WrbA
MVDKSMIMGDFMKVIAFNGSARKGGNTSQLLQIVLDQLDKEKIETELVELAGKRITGCIACYKCFERKNLRCAVEDDVIYECFEKMLKADAILLGPPTYFADVSAGMKALIERCGMVSKANGDTLKKKLGGSVVAVRRAGASHVFNSLNNFFLIGQMIVVGSSYWNIGIGREVGEVMKDGEGVRTMEDLGRNIAWLLHRIHNEGVN